MALFLEFGEHLQCAERVLQKTRPVQIEDKFQINLHKFMRFLETVDINPILENKNSSEQNFSIIFTLKLSQYFSVFYRFHFDGELRIFKFKITLVKNGVFLREKSSSILKNICKTIKSFNLMGSKSNSFFVIDSTTGQIIIKNECQLISNEEIHTIPFVMSLLSRTQFFMKSFTAPLLYSCNLIPRSSLENELVPALKNLFYGPHGEFHRYAEIYELMPLVNCPLEEEQTSDNSTAKNIVQCFYQHQNTNNKEVALYSEPVAYIPEQPINTFNKKSLNLFFPAPKEANDDQSFIFSTVRISAHDKKRERYISEGGKAKIIAVPTKMMYAKSMEITSKRSMAKKNAGDESTEETDDLEGTSENSIEIDKMLLVKLPLVSPREKGWKRLADQVAYQKDILTNLRGVKCGYISKYYHTTQTNFEYHPYLLMDYIPGNTLADESSKKAETQTNSAKLHILFHLSNAIRFLETHGISHLDISPHNVIVVKDYLIKLIDFGEAYHQKTSKKYSLQQRSHNKYVYSPGRTFPYAPPETSQRVQNFTNQQDMYSLGIIMYQLMFGAFPFTCSQETHCKLYQEKNYMARVFLAPERGEAYGQSDFISILMTFIMRLMDCSEHLRPFPVWTHIIIKKLFYVLR